MKPMCSCGRYPPVSAAGKCELCLYADEKGSAKADEQHAFAQEHAESAKVKAESKP